MDKQTTEQKVARAVLQQGVQVTVGKRTYTAAPPTVATLILASEYISRLPKVQLDNNRIAEESLAVARECRIIGDIIAIIILGAKKAGGFGISALVQRYRRRRLARTLLLEKTPNELHTLLAHLLKDLQLGDFFGLTTFLTGINLIHPTKVVNETTAFGQSSQES